MLWILLGLTVIVPGFVVTKSWDAPTRESWTVAVLRGTVVSLAGLLVVSLALLRAGLFRADITLAVMWLPAIAVLLLRRIRLRAAMEALVIRRADVGAVALVAAVAVVGIATPAWNFLVATGMDAGNYEVYAGWFSSTGSLYMDIEPLTDVGMDRSWIDGSNAWNLRGAWDAARPSYFYGYPALLGLVHDVATSPGVSMVVSLVVSAVALAGIYLLGLRLSERPVAAFVGSFLVFLSPMFLFYSKQTMSESLALAGFVAVLFGVVGTDRAGRPDTWMLAAGIVLAVVTKIDATLPIVVVAVATAAAAATGGWPRTSVPATWGWSGAAASVVSLLFVVPLVDPPYVGKSSLSGRLPFLEGMPGADLPMFAWLLLGCAILWAAVPYVLRHRRPSHRDRRTRLMSIGLAVGWLLYLGWNAFLRPATGTLDENHDALNLVRLDDVFSLVLLLAIAGAPLAILAIRREAPATVFLLAPLVIIFGYLVFESSHSRSELWWMRRYLVVLAPLAVVAVAAIVRAAARLPRRLGVTAMSVLAVIVVIATAVQTSHVWPLFSYHQHEHAVEQLGVLRETIPDDAVGVVVLGDSRIIRGVALVAAAHEGAPVANKVPGEAALYRFISSLPPGVSLSVVSDRPLPGITPLGFSLRSSGEFETRWANWFHTVSQDPRRTTSSDRYWSYARTEEADVDP